MKVNHIKEAFLAHSAVDLFFFFSIFVVCLLLSFSRPFLYLYMRYLCGERFFLLAVVVPPIKRTEHTYAYTYQQKHRWNNQSNAISQAAFILFHFVFCSASVAYVQRQKTTAWYRYNYDFAWRVWFVLFYLFTWIPFIITHISNNQLPTQTFLFYGDCIKQKHHTWINCAAVCINSR